MKIKKNKATTKPKKSSVKIVVQSPRKVEKEKESAPLITPSSVIADLQNNELEASGRPNRQGKRKYTYRSAETRARQLATLRPLHKGETANPNGRPRTKPFHNAARRLAESNWQDLGIKPDDTVAEAMMKMLVARAISPLSQQGVAAAKELADRAEGAPVQVLEHAGDGTGVASKGLEEILVRFGVQLAIRSNSSASV